MLTVIVSQIPTVARAQVGVAIDMCPLRLLTALLHSAPGPGPHSSFVLYLRIHTRSTFHVDSRRQMMVIYAGVSPSCGDYCYDVWVWDFATQLWYDHA